MFNISPSGTFWSILIADLVVASAGEDCKNSLWMKNGQTTRVVPQPDGETNDNIDVSRSI